MLVLKDSRVPISYLYRTAIVSLICVMICMVENNLEGIREYERLEPKTLKVYPHIPISRVIMIL